MQPLWYCNACANLVTSAGDELLHTLLRIQAAQLPSIGTNNQRIHDSKGEMLRGLIRLEYKPQCKKPNR